MTPTLVSRRGFVASLAAACSAPPAFAQPVRVPLVGVVRNGRKPTGQPTVSNFQRHMAALGWEDGRTCRMMFVYAEEDAERYPALLHELVTHGADVIVVYGDPAIQAAQRASRTIPIVGMADDLVGSGLVASMARPGGNTTGVSILASELDVKRLELLHEFVPKARRIAVLSDPTTVSTRPQLDKAAPALGVELVTYEAQNRDEIARALDAMPAAGVGAVNVLASPILNLARGVIVERLRRTRIPAIYQWPETAEQGGFLAYGPRVSLADQHVVGFVDKILRGARPADLPIEQPTRFDLVVNLKTATALGLTISRPLLLRADRVIE